MNFSEKICDKFPGKRFNERKRVFLLIEYVCKKMLLFKGMIIFSYDPGYKYCFV